MSAAAHDVFAPCPVEATNFVNQCLSAIDPRGSLLAIGELVANAAFRSPEFATVLTKCHDWLERPVSSRSAEILSRIDLSGLKRPASNKSDPEAIFQAASYLIATKFASSPEYFRRVEDSLARPAAAATTVARFLERHQSFVGDLMIEAGLRANRDPHFLATLNGSFDEFHALARAMVIAPWGRGMTPLLDRSDPTGGPNNDGGGGGAPIIPYNGGCSSAVCIGLAVGAVVIAIVLCVLGIC